MNEVSVNFYGVTAAMIASLALLALIARHIARGRTALIWLAASLVLGTGTTLLFKFGGAGPLAFAALALMGPLAIIAIAQAVRQSVDGHGSDPRWIAAALLLAASSLPLILFEIGSPVLRALPFQLGGLVMLIDMQRSLWRAPKTLSIIVLIAALLLHLVTHLLRMPYFPSLLAQGTAFPSAASGWLNWVTLSAASIFVPVVTITLIAREMNRVIHQHRTEAQQDDLTGLLTRIPFERAVEATHPQGGVLILGDIDRFKRINDQFGHDAGDETIRRFAALLAERDGIAARVGGEEFALALPGADATLGKLEADGLRLQFRALRLPFLEGSRRLSVSFGIAAYGPGTPFRAAYKQADAALYRAKRHGRNQVVLHDPAEDRRGEIAGFAY